MTSALGSLGALKAQKEEIAEQQRLRDRPKADWFTPPKDGTPVLIQFLNELDEDAKNFNPAFGTFLTSVEHMAPGPKGFMSRALDTTERDGRDWAQEQHLKDPKAGWKPRQFFYLNVAVLEADGTVVPKILQRNLSNQFVADLIEEYEDSDGQGITGQTYAIKRVGEGTSTQWRMKKVNEEMNLAGVEPWNLEEHAVKYIPYDKQSEFYMRNAQLPAGSAAPAGDSAPAASSGGGSEDKSWNW